MNIINPGQFTGTDTGFFLMDNKGVILACVDLTPHPFLITGGLQINPLVTLITDPIGVNRSQNYTTPNVARPFWINETTGGYGDQDVDWVNDLEELQQGIGVSSAVETPVDQVCHGEVGLLDLPVVVLQQIIKHLDGISYLNSVSADPRLHDLFTDAPATIFMDSLWRKTCLMDRNRGIVMKILISYDNVANRQRHGILFPPVPELTERNDDVLVSWEGICKKIWTLPELLYYGTVKDFHMTDVYDAVIFQINVVRTNVIDHTGQIRVNRLQGRNPAWFVGTAGSTAYSIVTDSVNPVFFPNMLVIEGLNISSAHRYEPTCLGVVEYVKILNVPLVGNESISSSLASGRVGRLLVKVSKCCVSFIPMQRGHDHHILFGNVLGPNERKIPLTAIHENHILIWSLSMNLKLYKCSIVNNHAVVDLMSEIRLENMVFAWDWYNCHRHYYEASLEKIRLSVEEKAAVGLVRLGNDNDANLLPRVEDDYYFEFRMTSFRFGRDSISFKNATRSIMGLIPSVILLHRSPQYFAFNAVIYRRQLNDIYSSAYKDGMYAVWNDHVLCVSWDGITWRFKPWNEILNRKAFEIIGWEGVSITHMVIVTHSCVIVAVQGVVHVIHVKISDATDKGDFHAVWMREIGFTFPNNDMCLDTLELDFNNGNPYLFLLYKRRNPTTVFDFDLLCVEFEPTPDIGDRKRNDVILFPDGNMERNYPLPPLHAPGTVRNIKLQNGRIPFLPVHPSILNLNALNQALQQVLGNWN